MAQLDSRHAVTTWSTSTRAGEATGQSPGWITKTQVGQRGERRIARARLRMVPACHLRRQRVIEIGCAARFVAAVVADAVRDQPPIRVGRVDRDIAAFALGPRVEM